MTCSMILEVCKKIVDIAFNKSLKLGEAIIKKNRKSIT